MLLPFDAIFSIYQYLGKEPYTQNNRTYIRFSKKYLSAHPASNLRRKITHYSSNIVLELNTNVSKRINPLNLIGTKCLYYDIQLDNRIAYRYEYGFTIIHDVAGQIYRKINQMVIINPIRHTIMNIECNKIEKLN